MGIFWPMENVCLSKFTVGDSFVLAPKPTKTEMENTKKTPFGFACSSKLFSI
jgi:hypothetical protein